MHHRTHWSEEIFGFVMVTIPFEELFLVRKLKFSGRWHLKRKFWRDLDLVMLKIQLWSHEELIKTCHAWIHMKTWSVKYSILFPTQHHWINVLHSLSPSAASYTNHIPWLPTWNGSSSASLSLPTAPTSSLQPWMLPVLEWHAGWEDMSARVKL